MRAVIQRVSRAGVRVEGKTLSEIGRGYVVLLGVERDDTEADAAYMAKKIASLRIFEDDSGRMNLSIKDVGGQVLCVSQFTLMGDVRKGRRPSFDRAEQPDVAEALYRRTIECMRAEGITVKEGLFGSHMEVSILNDGPVTILLDSKRLF